MVLVNPQPGQRRGLVLVWIIAAIMVVNRKMRERRYIVVVVKVYLMVKHQLGDVNRNPEGDGVWLHGGSSMQPVLDGFTIRFDLVHG